MTVVCEKCDWHKKSNEASISGRFIINGGDGLKFVKDGNPLEICQHNSCFERKTKWQPIIGKIRTVERVKGPAQLNKHGDCPYYLKSSFFRKLFSL